MARRKSAYQQFMSHRLKGTPSHQLPSAMRAAAADWRSGKRNGGGRRNPGGPSIMTLAIVGGAAYFGYTYLKKNPGALGATPAAAVKTP